MNIWFSSDFHYNHKNIVRGTSEWEDKNSQRTRNFLTLEEHNETLIKNINLSVKPDDTLYFLGDWSFGRIDAIWNFRKQLICKNIHFIYGNHDQHIEANKTIGVTDQDVEEYELTIDMYKYKGLNQLHLQNLFSSVSYYKELKINGRHFVLCHFAMRVWNKSHKGSIMLYGHSHGTLDQLQPEFTAPTWIGDNYYIKNYKTMDVGIDTHKDFRPYHINEIIEIMDKKEILLNIDHHSEKTN
tara:strand:- start:15350 stop:16072 length:723 start_codon:yes stop_codon:yes gene_type:complete